MTTRSARDGALALAAELRREGGTVAASLVADGHRRAVFADELPGAPQLAVGGPRAAGHEDQYELLLEMIQEGTLLHYGAGRVLRDDDPDLSLLLGDQLYALGLSRLAELGDLDAVAELADLISLLAQAQADGQPELAAAIWWGGAAAIGWGTTAEHEAAKALVRDGDDRAVPALGRAAERPGS
jgi:hypothetical protein